MYDMQLIPMIENKRDYTQMDTCDCANSSFSRSCLLAAVTGDIIAGMPLIAGRSVGGVSGDCMHKPSMEGSESC